MSSIEGLEFRTSLFALALKVVSTILERQKGQIADLTQRVAELEKNAAAAKP
ncbi:hypothetical protein ACFVUS_12660 [Nocardia sp. NPDC058058]|uniref:hypothetical protein n=1 Tax=Nocardia sp. NPDC058058 TaxID=3346317 RepID=UPI0036DC39CA